MRTLQVSAFIERDSEMELSTLRPAEPDGTLTLRFGRSHTINTTFFFDSPADLARFHRRIGDWLIERTDYAGPIAEAPADPLTVMQDAAPTIDDEFPF